MQASFDRLQFAPPPTPGLLRALTLAVLAHGLLLAALTWGIKWKHEAEVTSFEAELWSALPVEAAPALQVEPEPTPVAEPIATQPPPEVEPEPVVKPAEVDIALAREKLQQKKRDEARLEKLRQEKLRQEQARLEKLQEDRRKERDQKLKEAQEKKQAEKVARQIEEQRVKNLARMAGMAGASGAPSAQGSAQQSSGPSASYAGRIRARIKPNIVFTKDITGNPMAEVEVRTSPDGTIVGRKLLKSSGVTAWDEAVLQAIDKAEVLPRDIDGRVPAVLEISFRPKD
ncbi:MAG: cell envelope integrity protein TolA [Rhodoferax sp.]|jgi:colicin import membrane protein|uniref:cell envelope integrity protein TolA n=1 Tax=Rhodoferax sp. TaxID=50421 RepID=UPI001B50736D|nr:cell envelope integrity protein TolA [Rhodoferax sp.]MBP9150461.1 cell envelope integrity protein TolA [Rhodoferax sp.]MBP9737207.1 cell envelope integrity protein TolA [Rhodoferax sp.]